LAVKINGNHGEQQEICFNESFKRNYTISTGIPNLGMWCKMIFGHPESESDKKIGLWLLVLLRIWLQLHPKTSDPLRLQLHNRGWQVMVKTTNARWPIKGCEDADFCLVYFKRIKVNCQLNVFSQALMMSSKYPLANPNLWHHTKKSSNPKVPGFF